MSTMEKKGPLPRCGHWFWIIVVLESESEMNMTHCNKQWVMLSHALYLSIHRSTCQSFWLCIFSCMCLRVRAPSCQKVYLAPVIYLQPHCISMCMPVFSTGRHRGRGQLWTWSLPVSCVKLARIWAEQVSVWQDKLVYTYCQFTFLFACGDVSTAHAWDCQRGKQNRCRIATQAHKSKLKK